MIDSNSIIVEVDKKDIYKKTFFLNGNYTRCESYNYKVRYSGLTFNRNQLYQRSCVELLKKVDDLKIIIFRDEETHKVELPDLTKKQMLHFIRSGFTKKKFCCIDFVNLISGNEVSSEQEVNFFSEDWYFAPYDESEREMIPGDAIHLTNETRKNLNDALNNRDIFGKTHSAVYLGHDTFISLYGENGELHFSTLDQMKGAWQTNGSAFLMKPKHVVKQLYALPRIQTLLIHIFQNHEERFNFRNSDERPSKPIRVTQFFVSSNDQTRYQSPHLLLDLHLRPLIELSNRLMIQIDHHPCPLSETMTARILDLLQKGVPKAKGYGSLFMGHMYNCYQPKLLVAAKWNWIVEKDLLEQIQAGEGVCLTNCSLNELKKDGLPFERMAHFALYIGSSLFVSLYGGSPNGLFFSTLEQMQKAFDAEGVVLRMKPI